MTHRKEGGVSTALTTRSCTEVDRRIPGSRGRQKPVQGAALHAVAYPTVFYETLNGQLGTSAPVCRSDAQNCASATGESFDGSACGTRPDCSVDNCAQTSALISVTANTPSLEIYGSMLVLNRDSAPPQFSFCGRNAIPAGPESGCSAQAPPHLLDADARGGFFRRLEQHQR